MAMLVDHLAINPEDGDVIPGTCGVRKLRWGKAQASDLTPVEKRTLTALAAALKQGKG
jgi:hypothetical protein